MTRGAAWILKHESRTQCPVGSPSNFAGLNKLFTLFEPQVAFPHIDGEDLVGLQGVEVCCNGLLARGTTFAHRYISLCLAKNSEVS